MRISPEAFALAFLAFWAVDASGAEARKPAAYHFSAHGDDLRSPEQARRPSTPWKTLSKLDSLELLPGDSVLFKRGDTFAGTLIARRSGERGRPIHYGAYGQGAAPLISGAVPITGWKPYLGDIRVADAPRAVAQLFVDGRPMTLARFPNRGYLPIAKPAGETAFRAGGNGIPDAGKGSGWVGAGIHIKSERFSLDARKVARIDADSRTIHLDRRANYPLRPGRGFFLNGALAALDTAGEWHYDPARGKIYAWFPFGDSAANHSVEGSVFENGFEAKGKRFLRVENLRFARQSGSGLSLMDAGQSEIRGCSVEYPGAEGITLEGDGFALEGNSIHGAVRAGILLYGSGSRFSGNQVYGTGLIGRIGREGMGGRCCRGNAIEFYGGGNSVTGNRFAVSGHNGIRFEGVRSVVERNFVDSTCLVLDDAGGIYTWAAKYSDSGSSGSVIRDNIVLNSLGTGDGTGDTVTSANGIYLDDCTRGILVEGNTIANADIGIYLHNTRDMQIVGNTVFQNRSMQLYLKRDYLAQGEMFGNSIHGNLLITGNSGSDCSRETIYEAENLAPLAKYGRNHFCGEETGPPGSGPGGNAGPGKPDGRRRVLLYNDNGVTKAMPSASGGPGGAAVKGGPGFQDVPLFKSLVLMDGRPVSIGAGEGKGRE